jgi:hypothetical protein
MKALNIFNFSDKRFADIPISKNPAFKSKQDWYNINENGCYMICKTPNNKKYSVLLISPKDNPMEEDTVTKIAEFFNYETAWNWTNIIREHLIVVK